MKFFSLDSGDQLVSLCFWGVKTILKIAEANPGGGPDKKIPGGRAMMVYLKLYLGCFWLLQTLWEWRGPLHKQFRPQLRQNE